MKTSKIWALAAFVACVGMARSGHATEVGNERTFGLGFALGAPTSLVGKVFVGAGQAIDFGVGFVGNGYGYARRGCWDGRRYVNCGNGYSQLGLHADYLWQENLVYGKVTLDWHIGAGARMWILDQDNYVNDGDGTVALAARMPVGLDLMFQKPSFLEVFFEVVPSLYVVPGAGFDLEAALGARFYF
ncbi:MAG: DUF3996 domain-containing protein [Deltaproteobacteria bacterium]|nr:DUF3996 domain-containing protein [Deltaproteobacteria bacterium]